MSNSALAPSTVLQLDKTVAKLEKKLQNNPDDSLAARRLLKILDFHLPKERGRGSYSELQRLIADRCPSDSLTKTLSDPTSVARQYRKWNGFLRSASLMPQLAITQLYAGQFHSIHETLAYCGLHLSLFKENGVISRICHDCYKVQILPLDVMTFVRVYFVLRDVKLPRDNCRKCMIEMREGIKYPYKGYIYCESEDEASFCRDEFRKTLNSLGISSVYCGISHGCSEFGVRYPEFKYSNNGQHRNFNRPESWDRAEAKFFARNREAKRHRKDFNHEGITLSDLIGLKTWIDYAEIIGDEAYRQFREEPITEKPQPFAALVARQAQVRKDELRELAARIGSES